MKKVFATVVIVFALGFIISCTPEVLASEDTIELVDKNDVERPGDQGSNTSGQTASTDGN